MVKMAETSEDWESSFIEKSTQNHPDVEVAWADSAVDHMETHFNLITSVDPKMLKLTPIDDEIYRVFMEQFPDFKLDVLDLGKLKSKEEKEKWRNFCFLFKEKVDDSTYGTLVRIDSSGKYTEENTILVVRIQFLAIEIARNRHGCNDILYKTYKQEINQ